MIAEVLNGERASGALVVALASAIAAVVANGPRPLSTRRVVSGALSNPVSKGVMAGRGDPRPRDIEIPAPLPGR